MRSPPFRPVALLASLILAACDGDRLVEPSEEESVATKGAGTQVAAPSSLAAIAVSETRVDLAWVDNSSDETGFQLFRSLAGETGAFGLWTTLPANARTLTDNAAQPGTQYCFMIRAVRTTGLRVTYSAFSNTACATTPIPPPHPPPPPPTPPATTEGLAVVPYTSTAVWMTWGFSGDEDGFRIERSVDGGGSWSGIGTVSGKQIFYDQGLIGDQRVCYRVIAFNAGGDAAPSDPDCTAPPMAPSNLVGSLRADGAIDLTWSDNSIVEDGYEVVALITVYNHDCDAGCFDYTDEYTMGLLPANATTFTCTGCAGWPTYVRARKDSGTSSNSNLVQVPSSP